MRKVIKSIVSIANIGLLLPILKCLFIIAVNTLVHLQTANSATDDDLRCRLLPYIEPSDGFPSQSAQPSLNASLKKNLLLRFKTRLSLACGVYSQQSHVRRDWCVGGAGRSVPNDHQHHGAGA